MPIWSSYSPTEHSQTSTIMVWQKGAGSNCTETK
jgi:hypothetical protein